MEAMPARDLKCSKQQQGNKQKSKIIQDKHAVSNQWQQKQQL